jgi:hypothetical protein
MGQRHGGPGVRGGEEGGGVSTLATPGTDDPPIRGSRRRNDPAWDDWKKPRRWPGVLLTCAVVLAFIGVVVWHYRPSAGTKKPVNPVAYAGRPNGAFVPLVSGHGAAIRTFKGTHNAQQLRYGTDGNLMIMHATCACAYNFVVTITNPVGTPVAFPVSTSGAIDVTVNVTLPRGVYFVNVVAPTPATWTVSLIQPQPGAPLIPTPAAQWCKKHHPPPCPFSYYTFHQSVLGPFSGADRYLYFKFFSLTNGTARVYVVDAQGVHVEQAIFARTSFNSGAALPRPPNPYYVEVDSTGGYYQLNVQRSAAG